MAKTAPDDWRLSPTALQERDGYFTRLKSAVETLVKLHGWGRAWGDRRQHEAVGNSVNTHGCEKVPGFESLKWLN